MDRGEVDGGARAGRRVAAPDAGGVAMSGRGRWAAAPGVRLRRAEVGEGVRTPAARETGEGGGRPCDGVGRPRRTSVRGWGLVGRDGLEVGVLGEGSDKSCRV